VGSVVEGKPDQQVLTLGSDVLCVVVVEEAENVEVVDRFVLQWGSVQVGAAAGLKRRWPFQFASIPKVFGRTLTQVAAPYWHTCASVEARVTGACRQWCSAVVSSKARRTNASESVVKVLTGRALWTRVTRTVINLREAVLSRVSRGTDTDVSTVRVRNASRTKETRERYARTDLALRSADARRTDTDVTVLIVPTGPTVLTRGWLTWSRRCLTELPSKAWCTGTRVGATFRHASRAILTAVTATWVRRSFTSVAGEVRRTGTVECVDEITTRASVHTRHAHTFVDIRLTEDACVPRHTDADEAIDKVRARCTMLAGLTRTLVNIRFTVSSSEASKTRTDVTVNSV